MAATITPVVDDQYTAARIYFGCVVGMLLIESLIYLPQHIRSFLNKGRPLIKPSPKSHNTLTILGHKLTTLPSPIPFLTAHSYPSYLRIIVFLALNILFGINRIKFTTDYKLYGWLTLSNGGIALLLSPRGSLNLLSACLQIPTPTLLAYHRWAGVAATVHASLHFGLTAAHNNRTGQLDRVLANAQIQGGLIAYTSLAIIFITSIRPIRRRFFEIFYYPHFLFLVFVAGGIYHAVHAKEFFVPGLALWFLDRAWRVVRSWFKTVDVREVTHYEGDVTKIVVNGVASKTPGQIAWVQFPDVSNITWHPFTVAYSPHDSSSTFAIRGLGCYTKAVQKLDPAYEDAEKTNGSGDKNGHRAMTTSNLKMKIDGPHGVGAIKWGQHPVTVLVAGGIGITPGISIASHIIAQATSPAGMDVEGTWHIHLLWILKSASHANWFATELSHLVSLVAGSGGKVTFDITIHYTSAAGAWKEMDRPAEAGSEENHMSSSGYSGPGKLVQGRPDILAWFSNIRTIRSGLDAAVNLCGPRKMIDTAREAAATVSWSGSLFEVEEEVFEY